MKSVDSEKESDVLDQAAKVTDFLTAARVELQRAAARPENHPDFDGLHCVEEECGVEIPGERLEMGRIRCVECQARREANAKRFGR